MANQDLLAEYSARNPAALETLLTKHQVDIRRFPDDVVQRLRELSEEVVAELANTDDFSKKVFASYDGFYRSARKWSRLSEHAYLNARDPA